MSYPDNNTPYIFPPELDATLKRLKTYTIKIFEWFPKNRFKCNHDKCNFITTSKPQKEIQTGESSLTSVVRVNSVYDNCLPSNG